MLFLKALHDLLDDKDFNQRGLKDEIYNHLLSTGSSNRKMKLKPIEDDLDMYDRIMSRSIRVNLADLHKSRIVENYKLFKSFIAQNKHVGLEAFFDAFCLLQVILIELEHDIEWQNPQVVFESLNSTGMNLTQADLIRNFVLMRKHPSEQESFYQEYWKPIENMYREGDELNSFLSVFTDMKCCRSCGNEYYNHFKLKYMSDEEDIDDLASELKIASKCFSYMIRKTKHPNDEVDILLDEFALFKVKTMDFLVLYLLMEADASAMFTYKELIKCLKLLINYLYRHQMCKTNTSAFKSPCSQILKRFEDTKMSVDSHYNNILYVLCSRADYGFPSDQELKEAFLTKLSYRDNRHLIRYTLVKINNFLSNQTSLFSFDNYTIEHIMPQVLTERWSESLGKDSETIHEECLDLIGNLTLVDDNSEIERKIFNDKQNYYRNSSFRLTRDLIAFSDWNDKSIRKRCSILCNEAIKIWPMPVNYREIVKSKSEFDYQTPYLFDCYKTFDVKPLSLSLGHEVKTDVSTKTWRKVVENIISYVLQNKHDDFMFLVRQGKYTYISATPKLSYILFENEVYIPQSLSAERVVGLCRLIVEDLHLIGDIELYFKRIDSDI
jgi:hypothetical protein